MFVELSRWKKLSWQRKTNISWKLFCARLRLTETHILSNIHTYSLTHKHTLRGHSNNTWHFLSTFLTPPPPVWHFSIFDDWFLGLNCSKISNELERKFLLGPYLALWQKVSCPKAIIPSFLKQKKVCVTFRRPPPLWVSRIIWMTPYIHTHSLSQSNTHTHTHTHTHTYIHSLSQSNTHAHIRTHSLSQSNTHIRTNTLSLNLTHTHMYTLSLSF